jgi:hypothetical protein
MTRSNSLYNRLSITNHEGIAMDRRTTGLSKPTEEPKKIYITLIGSAPMASLDALILSLDRFKNILTSDSAIDNFETTLRSIQPSLMAVNAFIDAVYAEVKPMLSVSSKNFTLIVEVAQTKTEFLECIHDHDANEILAHVIAVGTMPPKKTAPQKPRDYKVFPVKYVNGKFIK